MQESVSRVVIWLAQNMVRYFPADKPVNHTLCDFHEYAYYLTDSSLVPHICVSEMGQQWFRSWLAAYSVPSHYLNQCSLIVNWTLRSKIQWNSNQNPKCSFKKIHLKQQRDIWLWWIMCNYWARRDLGGFVLRMNCVVTVKLRTHACRTMPTFASTSYVHSFKIKRFCGLEIMPGDTNKSYASWYL